MNYGWICTRCQKSNSPQVKSCECTPFVYPGPTVPPFSPYKESQPGDPLQPLPIITCEGKTPDSGGFTPPCYGYATCVGMNHRENCGHISHLTKIDFVSLNKPITI